MELFTEVSIVLLVTVVVVTLLRVLSQPLIIGYIISGILLGPYVFDVLHSTQELEMFSKIGIVTLLFIVGLSLNPESIKETGKKSLLAGIFQIVLTTMVGYGILVFLGYSMVASLYGAVALTLSSTIIILKILSDKGDIHKLYGKMSLGVLLVQDIVATILLILLPLFGQNTEDSITLTVASLALKGTAISLLLYVIAKYLLPKFSDYLARSGELLFLFSLSWGLVLATLFYKIGFSIEIGALIAGITLSASKYSYEISSRLKPLRDFCIVLFFVLLGSHVDLQKAVDLIPQAIVLSVFVLLINPVIVYIVMNVQGFRNRTAFMSSITLGQVSEFSLILLALGFSLGQIDSGLVTIITLVAIITIAGSSYMMTYSDILYEYLKKQLNFVTLRKKHAEAFETLHDPVEMMIFGFGRVGHDFVSVAKRKHISYLAVDYNPSAMYSKNRKDAHVRYGDAEDVEFLHEIDFQKARIIVSTIPDKKTNILLIKEYRKTNKTGVFLAMSHSVDEAHELYDAGVTYVILPHYLGAFHASELLVEYTGDPTIFEYAKTLQFNHINSHSNNNIT